MTTKQPLLELDPAVELRFRGPFTNVVTTELVLTNIASDRVLFKIKTTAPRRYCVRPNSGIITTGDRAIITIMLQPQDFDPIAEKGKHKFMVQSCIAPADFVGDAANSNIDTVWKEIPADRIIDTRLKCCFVENDEVSDDGTGKSAKSSAAEHHENIESRRSPPTLETRPHDADVAKSVTAASPVDDSNSKGGASAGAGQDKQLAADNERLRNQLADLQKQHAQLRQSELRLRNVAAQSSVSQATSTQPRTVQAQSTPTYVIAIVFIMALIIGILVGRLIL